MREIKVETEVFARIWALREEGEECENDILKRLLTEGVARLSTAFTEHSSATNDDATRECVRHEREDEGLHLKSLGKVRWVDDVVLALQFLGGGGVLHEIYKKVEEIRTSTGRSVPKSLEATIRRTIEDHSSDSDNFRGVDLFKKVGRGEWALRSGV